jgi:plasmid stability protein
VKKGAKKKSYIVGFRLDEYYLAELEKRAAPDKTSIHEQARRIVINALNDTERGAVKEEVSAARQDIKNLKLSLADAMEAILITAGNYPQDKAREWTNDNIRKR